MFTKDVMRKFRILSAAFAWLDRELYFVGGCVRDALMGKTPKDYDFATNATPDDMEKIAYAHGFKFIPTGIDHGTVTIGLDDMMFEVTTFRKDAETDGRHAEVEYGVTMEEDAARRDFAMNAIYYDGRAIYDFHGGVVDIVKKRIRFVGNPMQRIREDYLRSMRAWRFASQLSFYVDKETLAYTLSKEAADGLLNCVSHERIWSELKKILMGENAPDVLNLLREHPLFTVHAGIGSTIGNLHDAVCYAGVTWELNSNIQKIQNPVTRLFALLNFEDSLNGYAPNIPNIDARKIADWLKMSKRERDLFVYLCDNWVPSNVENELSTSYFLDMMKLRLTNRNPDLLEHVVENLRLVAPNFVIDEIVKWEVPTFPVSGDDLIEIGVAPGRTIGVVLDALRVEWQNSNFTLTKEDLLSGSKKEAIGDKT